MVFKHENESRKKRKVEISLDKNKIGKHAKDTPMFGMYRKHRKTVSQIMEELRGGRFKNLRFRETHHT